VDNTQKPLSIAIPRLSIEAQSMDNSWTLVDNPKKTLSMNNNTIGAYLYTLWTHGQQNPSCARGRH